MNVRRIYGKYKSHTRDRAVFVQKEVGKSDRTDTAVARLAKRLFLSESTIYKDLAREL